MNSVPQKTILIVEDEPELRSIVAERLAKEGLKILEAGDGEEGLEKALTEHPDLIILDVLIPKVDGLVLLSELRADKWGKNARVIILTNLNDPTTILKSLAGGVKDVYVKADWKLEDIVAKIKQRLAEK